MSSPLMTAPSPRWRRDTAGVMPLGCARRCPSAAARCEAAHATACFLPRFLNASSHLRAGRAAPAFFGEPLLHLTLPLAWLAPASGPRRAALRAWVPARADAGASGCKPGRAQPGAATQARSRATQPPRKPRAAQRTAEARDERRTTERAAQPHEQVDERRASPSRARRAPPDAMDGLRTSATRKDRRRK